MYNKEHINKMFPHKIFQLLADQLIESFEVTADTTFLLTFNKPFSNLNQRPFLA